MLLEDFSEFRLTSNIEKNYRVNESFLLAQLSDFLSPIQTESFLSKTRQETCDLILKIRAKRLSQGGIDAFMAEYDLSSLEGITLMCLAESLLRVPDAATIDKLIQDKIAEGNWETHLKKSESLFVNAATWGLMLTGKVLDPKKYSEKTLARTLQSFIQTNSRLFIRKTIQQAMRIIGQQFVMGEEITDALKRAKENEANGYSYSYDMLGEAAYTRKDAEFYFEAYTQAIHKIGKAAKTQDPRLNPGISIKLSALHPRYEFAQHQRVFKELLPKVKTLCSIAKQYQIHLTIDAEESERLELSLKIFESLAQDSDLESWEGLGLAVQAYQKRAFFVLDFLFELAQSAHRKFMIRLVKGAYWDSEIKRSQSQGYLDYPVFTRKKYTDLSYLACAKKLFENISLVYPMFATHNAYTVSTLLNLCETYKINKESFELQCLHGMGSSLYDHIVGPNNLNIAVRVYAPVGTYKHLLAYLVRRLLENGANTSFVNRILDQKLPPEAFTENPTEVAKRLNFLPHPHIPNPLFLYGAERMNAKGLDISDQSTLLELKTQISKLATEERHARPKIFGLSQYQGELEDVINPATLDIIGSIQHTTLVELETAMEQAQKAFPTWRKTPVEKRAFFLNNIAELLEKNTPLLLSLLIREAGKTLPNAIAELREAVDFCRYYAAEALRLMKDPVNLPGPTGEKNQLILQGKGIFACISPWNFPLAIFLGQIVAALVAGNTVIAKPAEQTPLIADFTVDLIYEAGIPKDVLQLTPGTGETLGSALVQKNLLSGVIFTGSNETARRISQTLAQKPGPISTLIAETGGQNCMIVDSTALPEQVVRDVIASSFDSAGQRCSALRVLFIQSDIAAPILEMLHGAMLELNIGDPSLLATDIGPVIDQDAKAQLDKHIKTMMTRSQSHEKNEKNEKNEKSVKLLFQYPKEKMPENDPLGVSKGTFVPPTVFEIKNISQLSREVFGPILHVIQYKESELNDIIDQINSTGYGLTFGIHSRIQHKVQDVTQRIHAGNIYINRNMIGAVVGTQPFGGEGLSGTGFKAGGPHYLLKLTTERCITEDITASGGNAKLLSLEEG